MFAQFLNKVCNIFTSNILLKHLIDYYFPSSAGTDFYEKSDSLNVYCLKTHAAINILCVTYSAAQKQKLCVSHTTLKSQKHVATGFIHFVSLFYAQTRSSATHKRVNFSLQCCRAQAASNIFCGTTADASILRTKVYIHIYILNRCTYILIYPAASFLIFSISNTLSILYSILGRQLEAVACK